jgi:3-dehydroquinate synthase
MKSVKVHAERDYKVEIGISAQTEVKNISEQYQKLLILAPNSIVKKYGLRESRRIFIFTTPEGELQKSVSVLNRVWQRCAQVGLERSDAIIGFGGGATTDLAGFSAATWLRGIDWFAMPTSLAGMVDAAIGGKTGINSSTGKNLIGSFYSPSKVLIDTNFLSTLTLRDINAGMAEIIKYGFIADYKILNLVQDAVPDFEGLIYRSVKVKSKVVGKDFRESRAREVLNYGHTLGHAIEKDTQYKMRHGEAVAIGMVFAAELSRRLSGLSDDVVDLHRVLLRKFNLPTSYPKNRIVTLQKLLLKDKKVKSGKLRFIGLKAIGKPVWLEDVKSSDLVHVYERIAR